MRTMYPDVDDGSEHPMTAVGVVLLAEGIFGITDEDAIARFTGYLKSFIFAMVFNLRESGVWENASYDCGGWLSSAGAIDGEALWNHLEVAYDLSFLSDIDSPSLDPCQIYWKNKTLS